MEIENRTVKEHSQIIQGVPVRFRVRSFVSHGDTRYWCHDSYAPSYYTVLLYPTPDQALRERIKTIEQVRESDLHAECV